MLTSTALLIFVDFLCRTGLRRIIHKIVISFSMERDFCSVLSKSCSNRSISNVKSKTFVKNTEIVMNIRRLIEKEV